jgi:hypothetical protein
MNRLLFTRASRHATIKRRSAKISIIVMRVRERLKKSNTYNGARPRGLTALADPVHPSNVYSTLQNTSYINERENNS